MDDGKMYIHSFLKRHLQKSRFSLLSIRTRLIFLVILAVLPVFGLTLYTGAEERQLRQFDAQEDVLRLVRLISSEQENMLEGTRQLLVTVASLPSVRDGNADRCGNLLSRLLEQNPQYAIVGLISPESDLLCSSPKAGQPVNLSDRTSLKQALLTRGFAIGECYVGPITGKYVLTLSHPVFSEAGQVQGVVFAAIDLLWLNRPCEKTRLLPPGANVTVVDRNNTILLRYPDDELWAGRRVPEESVIKFAGNGQEGITEGFGINGTPKLYAFKPLQVAGGVEDLYIYVSIPKKDVFADADRLQARNMYGLGMIAVLVLTIAWFGGDFFLLRRVRALMSTTERLAAGDLSARTGISYGPGELSQLARAFDRMAAKLEAQNTEIRRAETKYRTLVEQLPAVLYISTLTEPANTFYVSPQIESLLGFTPAEWKGEPERWLKQLHPDDRQRVLDEFFESKAAGRTFRSEYRLLTRSGDVVWVRDEAVEVCEESGSPCIQGVILDITERKRAEKCLCSSEERFAKAFNASPAAMAIIKVADKCYVEVNDSFEKITGYRREEVIGREPNELNLWVDPEDQDRAILIISEQGKLKNFEALVRTKSGAFCLGLFSAEIISLGDEPYILTVMNDITQLRQFENEIARLDRLNLVGEMAAGIGHEIRNPMTTVRGFLQILGSKQECAQYREFYDLMIEELDRANSIITEFLSLAKNKPLDKKRTNLNAIVETLLPLVQTDAAVADKQVQVEMEETPDLLLDQKEIRQLILNLTRNGLEAMKPHGNLFIKTYADCEEVVLSVQDQGTGIEPGLLDKLGTPFFTTKETGTGLGLAICYSIADRHDAAVKVETGPTGTTFMVRFKQTDCFVQS